jgi:hypothetical protein
MPFPTIAALTQQNYNSFTFVLSQETTDWVTQYLDDLKNEQASPGTHLGKILENQDLTTMTPAQLIRCILNTKQPKAFAEEVLKSKDSRSKSCYTDLELRILARIGTVTPTYVRNDGGHYNSFKNHDTELPCYMGVVSAPLFTQDGGSLDDALLEHAHKINIDLYNQEIEQRLLPVLIQMNQQAESNGDLLSVTIPGLGCGLFAGPLSGKSEIFTSLQNALKQLLEKHGSQLGNIKEIYFDTFAMIFDQPTSTKIYEIDFVCVSSSNTSYSTRRQLAKAPEKLTLATIVAGDLLSWVGNDMWVDSRATDEGVKCGSSLALVQIACAHGIDFHQFQYNETLGKYEPANHEGWNNLGARLIESKSYATHAQLMMGNHQVMRHQETLNEDGSDDLSKTSSPANPSFAGDSVELSCHYVLKCLFTLGSSALFLAIGTTAILGGAMVLGVAGCAAGIGMAVVGFRHMFFSPSSDRVPTPEDHVETCNL